MTGVRRLWTQRYLPTVGLLCRNTFINYVGWVAGWDFNKLARRFELSLVESGLVIIFQNSSI